MGSLIQRKWNCSNGNGSWRGFLACRVFKKVRGHFHHRHRIQPAIRQQVLSGLFAFGLGDGLAGFFFGALRRSGQQVGQLGFAAVLHAGQLAVSQVRCHAGQHGFDAEGLALGLGHVGVKVLPPHDGQQVLHLQPQPTRALAVVVEQGFAEV